MNGNGQFNRSVARRKPRSQKIVGMPNRKDDKPVSRSASTKKLFCSRISSKKGKTTAHGANVDNEGAGFIAADYFVNFVGHSAFVVSSNGKGKVLVALDFESNRVSVEVQGGSAFCEVIDQSIAVGEQIERKPFFELVANLKEGPVPVEFQGIGLFRAGKLEYRSINQTIEFYKKSGELYLRTLRSDEIERRANIIGSPENIRQVDDGPALWTLETTSGATCALREYWRRTEVRDQLAEASKVGQRDRAIRWLRWDGKPLVFQPGRTSPRRRK